MRLLFLSSWFPYPPNNGSKLRIYNLLQGLAEQHEVTLISFADCSGVDPAAPALRWICPQVHVVPWRPFVPHSRQARLGFLCLKPRSVIDTFSVEMAHCIERVLTSTSYDLIIASQINLAGYSRFFGQTPALFEEVEVALLYEQFSQATCWSETARRSLTWLKHRAYLNHLLDRFEVATVVSEQEKTLLQQTVGCRLPVEVIPNCVDVACYRPFWQAPQPDTLIFTGAFTYHVNYEAMVWFLKEVYPLIKAQVPAVRITITGDHANLPLPLADDVMLTGFIDDVRPLLASSWISIAPILQGGGTRLKILEAMALQTPVVATSKGAEGLQVQHGEHLLLADTPGAFAHAVASLLQDPALRRCLAHNAYELVRQEFNWPAVIPRFLRVVEGAATSRE
jgi:polysaccharide biosynthesis protein PslH